MVAGNDRAAALARTVLYETLIYSANRLGEIADDIVDIDRALRWGFGWERGPFETWDALGVKATAAKMEAAGYTVPGWVREQIAAQGEGMRFYARTAPGKRAQLGMRGGFTPVADDPRELSLDAVRAARRRGRAQRQRVDPRPRRRRLLPRVPRQDERHRSRHRRHDDEGGRPRRARRRRRW